jgi:hypothetical protein
MILEKEEYRLTSRHYFAIYEAVNGGFGEMCDDLAQRLVRWPGKMRAGGSLADCCMPPAWIFAQVVCSFWE